MRINILNDLKEGYALKVYDLSYSLKVLSEYQCVCIQLHAFPCMLYFAMPLILLKVPLMIQLSCAFFSIAQEASRAPLFSSTQGRESQRQRYPFVFDSFATRKQSSAYIGGSKVI